MFLIVIKIQRSDKKKYFLWYKINILKKIRTALPKHALSGNMAKKNDSKMISLI